MKSQTRTYSRIKADNKALNHAERATNSPVIQSLPLVAKIEVTNRCNLRCIMCRDEHDTRVIQELDPAVFARLKRIFPTLLSVYLYGIGEVLTYRHLDRLIDQLLAFDIDVGLITNGMLITDPLARSWVERGLYKLSISVDAATAHNYERIRRGASFAKLLAHLASIKKWKHHFGLSRPIVTINYVAMRSTIEELPALIELAHTYDATEVIVSDLIVFFDQLKEEALAYDEEIVTRTFQSAMCRAQELGIRLVLPVAYCFQNEHTQTPAPEKTVINPCTEAWSGFWLTAEGVVTPCCYWMKPMGDLKKDDFNTIWNNDEYQHLRNTVNTEKRNAQCRRCAIAGMHRR
jgi:radical SAM protein with 4Fe4S-binding SPASM domain